VLLNFSTSALSFSKKDLCQTMALGCFRSRDADPAILFQLQ
jgi:hypothetical protein